MKKLLLIILISCNLFALSIQEWDKVFQSLSIQERSNLVKTYVKSLPFDLAESLTAIHLKESTAGRYDFNVNKGTSIDVGDFMINTKEYNRRRGIINNKWNTARAMEVLQDYETNYLEALTILQDCHKESNGDWKKTYRYYNGWKSGSKRSYAYSKDIQNILVVIRKYFNHPTLIKN